MSPSSRTIVVGAGLSGLACAFDLRRAGQRVLVLDAAVRPGGVVGSVQSCGFLFETGPHTVQGSARDFLALCGDLGIAERLVVADGRATRWLWHSGELAALPSTPLALATTKLLSWRAKLRIASEPFRRFDPSIHGDAEPSFARFLEERIGPEPTRRFAGAFVRGVFAAEIDELGARSAFPRVWSLAVEHGGLVRGLLALKRPPRPTSKAPHIPSRSLLSFPGGLVELVDALQRELEPVLHTRREVARVERFGRGYNVALTSGSSAFAERVVLAVPAPVAARLLEEACAQRVDLAALRDLRQASVTVVHLGFQAGVELPRGFGYLVPPDADTTGSKGPLALGTIFASNLFAGRAPRGGASIASFYRGSDVAHLDDARLVARAEDDLALALGARTRPAATLSAIQRWNDVIPRYAPEHDRRTRALVAALRAHLPGVELAGNHVAGVSVDAVIARGRAVARTILHASRHEESSA